MGKKIPLLISTLTILANVLPVSLINAYADESGIDPRSHNWSVSDLVEMQKEVNAELSAICADDMECRRNTKYEKYETDYRYSIVDAFNHTFFTISAINPSQSTVKVFFQDEVESPIMMDETEHAVVQDLYLHWFEDGPMEYGSFYRNVTRNALTSGESVFIGKASELGSGWLTPNQEVTLTIENGEILSRNPHMLEYYIKADVTDSVNSINYDSCVSSPFYHAGMECRLMYNSWLDRTYFPFEPDEPTPFAKTKASAAALSQTVSGVNNNDANSTDDSTIDDTSTTVDNIAATVEEAATMASNDIAVTTEDASKGSIVVEDIPSVNTRATTKSPETGVGKYRESSEFPWWLGAIILFGLCTLIWFFGPFHRKNRHSSPKSPKNFKKLLTFFSK